VEAEIDGKPAREWFDPQTSGGVDAAKLKGESTLYWPVLFAYPEHMQSDFIEVLSLFVSLIVVITYDASRFLCVLFICLFLFVAIWRAPHL
jgi:hypothetical protein